VTEVLQAFCHQAAVACALSTDLRVLDLRLICLTNGTDEHSLLSRDSRYCAV
jgi:hypothetical protein